MAKLLEITGKAISGEWGQDDDTGTGIPVLRTTNFTNEGFVNYKNVVTRSISKKNIAEKYLRHGDIIIEKSGGSDKRPVGRVIFFEGEENKYLFNNFTGLLRVQNPEEWLPKYVFYALYAYYRNGGTRAFENRTTGLHNLQVDNYVKSVDIPKLSYRKQQHICETLDHVRDAVAYRERQLTKLDELVKARFVEMFGGYAPNAKLSDVASITGGLTKNSNRNIMKLKLPYLRVANVSYAKIDVSEMLEIGLTEDERAKTLLSYDDLLFVEGMVVLTKLVELPYGKMKLPLVFIKIILSKQDLTATLSYLTLRYIILCPERVESKSKAKRFQRQVYIHLAFLKFPTY